MSTSRSNGVAPAPLVEGPTRAPGCTFRSVMTPANGAVIRRYPSMSRMALSACRAASTPCSAARTWSALASAVFSAIATSFPATTPGVADAALSLANVLLSASAFARATDSCASAALQL